MIPIEIQKKLQQFLITPDEASFHDFHFKTDESRAAFDHIWDCDGNYLGIDFYDANDRKYRAAAYFNHEHFRR